MQRLLLGAFANRRVAKTCMHACMIVAHFVKRVTVERVTVELAWCSGGASTRPASGKAEDSSDPVPTALRIPRELPHMMSCALAACHDMRMRGLQRPWTS
jgi:hypothetical protein